MGLRLFARRPRPAPYRPHLTSHTYLDVPFSDNDTIKRLGAHWNGRSWWTITGSLPRWDPWRQLPTHLEGEDRTYGQGLFVDMIPSSAWGQNARGVLDGRQWHRVSMMCRRRAKWTCEACGTSFSANHGLLEAHERWLFENDTQRLVRLICLCAA